MRTVEDIDTALRRCLARRKAMTAREFEAITNSLLEARHYLTRPDTGDTIPTREAPDGSTRTPAGPQPA